MASNEAEVSDKNWTEQSNLRGVGELKRIEVSEERMGTLVTQLYAKSQIFAAKVVETFNPFNKSAIYNCFIINDLFYGNEIFVSIWNYIN